MNKRKTISAVIAVFVVIIIVGAITYTYINQAKARQMNAAEKMLIEKVEMEADGINAEFVKIEYSLQSVADLISSMDPYDEAVLKSDFGRLLKSDGMFLRSGYWFEPEQFRAGEKYHAYFFSKGGTTVTLTKDYSNVEYDYFNEDWYKEGMAETDDIFYTPPFFDTALKLYMMTAEKKFVRAGKPIGLVVLDLNLKGISEQLKLIKVGTASTIGTEGTGGTAFIITQEGFYLGERTRTRGDLQKKITEETDEDLKALGASIMAGKFDQLHKISSSNSFAISHPIGNSGLILVLLCPESEI